ncbi:MAG: hypothetical protein IPK97_13400 [Ahniella sp.]|nr:hypothetical protein [Ahniella sp.]
MSQDPLRIEFRVELANRRVAPKPVPGAKADRQRLDRAARRARNLALAYWIDHLIRTGQVADLATVARMCGVSRARVTRVRDLVQRDCAAHESILALQISVPAQ